MALARCARRRGTGRGSRSAPRAAAPASGWCRRRSGRRARHRDRKCLDSETWTKRSTRAAVDRGVGRRAAPRAPGRRADIFDAHLHLGHDIDGMVGDYDELELVMERYGISRAFMFCMDEPDRHPAFRAAERPDARVRRPLRGTARSRSSASTWASEPIEEAERCLDLGAKGIKLHPRAQKFLLNDERLAPVFAIAAERKVPILIHGGRGLPPIADDLARLVDTYPGRPADHRPRRDRRPRRPDAPLRRQAPASSSTRPPGARSTCSTSSARSRRSRCCTPRTTPTASSRHRC